MQCRACIAVCLLQDLAEHAEVIELKVHNHDIALYADRSLMPPILNDVSYKSHPAREINSRKV